MSIRTFVENKSELDYQALTTSLISEFGITDPIKWDAVIPANVQQNLFGGETLRLFEDHPNFATQKDIRTIVLKKGQTSQLLILFAKLKDEKLSKSNIEKVTKKFIGGSAAERYVVWFVGNPSNTQFKVVLSGKEGKKIVLKTLPFGVEQPYYKTYDFIMEEVHKKTAHLSVEPNELWKALWKSFDISVVNKKFYLDIKSSFDSLINDDVFKGSIRIEEARKQFAVRLIGRIIFSWFLKKKNIISETVLSSNAILKYENYYLEFLEKLFFEVFNTPQKERGNLPDEIKDYPFLNGGLFEAQVGDYGDYQGKVFIDNEWFTNLFKNTLEKYNFTIDENTSANSEIAIDPEMLGRIFENLLAEQNPETQESARKSTGSYYTPREIVDYMVEQSVSEYLKSNIIQDVIANEVKQSQNQTESVILNETKWSEESYNQAIEDFVHTEEFPEALKPFASQIFDKLNSVKVLDPACGSGAFPIGMLQKLFALKNQLSTAIKVGNTKGAYELKLQTILNSIYGCDIQPMAVELSRLRCWLSLIIDEDVDKKKPNWGIANLPNLDFKFVCVNTLIGLPKMEQDSLGTSAEDFNNLRKLREEFFTASAKHKIQIEKEFTELQQNVAEKQREWSTKNTEAVTKLVNWNPFKVEKTDWFDPFWMFGINDGFDIAIGNPPYGAKTTKKEKEYFRKNYLSAKSIKNVQIGSTDTFAMFIENSLFKVSPNKTIMCIIVPMAFTSSESMYPLHQLMISNCEKICISTYFERPKKIFNNAEISVSIVLAIKNFIPCSKLLTTKVIKRYINTPISQIIDRLNFVNSIEFVHRGRIPKIGSEIERSILNKIYKLPFRLRNFIDYDSQNINSETTVYYRFAGGRYYKIITNYSTGSSAEAFFNVKGIERDIVCAILSSNLSYWFYHIHCNYPNWKFYELEIFPFPKIVNSKKEEIIQLYNTYLIDLKKNSRIKKVNYSHISEYREYYARKSKHIIDKIDLAIKDAYGLTDEEINFIINYDLEFRTDDE